MVRCSPCGTARRGAAVSQIARDATGESGGAGAALSRGHVPGAAPQPDARNRSSI